MDCNDVAMLQLIEGYLDETLPRAQTEAFEKHYLGCERCFSDLQLQHAIRLEAGRTATPSDRSEKAAPGRQWYAKSRRWLLPIAALIVLLVVPLSLLIDRDSGTAMVNLPAQLVEIESLPAYVETTMRGAGDFLEAFRRGMAAYQREDYQAAVQELTRAQTENPENVPTAFYLGLSGLAAGNPSDAARQLSNVVLRGNTPYLEEARWYLAKAYFRLGKIEAARQQLEAVREMDGAFRQDAEQNLALLDSLQR